MSDNSKAKTENYGFNLPAFSEFADIRELDENFEKIDKLIKQNEKSIKNIEVDGGKKVDEHNVDKDAHASGIAGNAATATKLQTARKINGVAFNGTTDIAITDDTKQPYYSGTIKIAGDANKFYPVAFWCSNGNDGKPFQVNIRRPKHMDAQDTGFLDFEMGGCASGWGSTPPNIYTRYYSNVDFVADAKPASRSNIMHVWLKGGGITYYWGSTHPIFSSDIATTDSIVIQNDTLASKTECTLPKGIVINGEQVATMPILDLYAKLESPKLTGIPIAPLPNGKNSAQIATVGYVIDEFVRRERPTGVKTFNTVGAFTWTVPDNISEIYVSGSAGGGGGGGGSDHYDHPMSGVHYYYAGGAGGAGEDTTIKNLLTLSGGSGGGGAYTSAGSTGSNGAPYDSYIDSTVTYGKCGAGGSGYRAGGAGGHGGCVYRTLIYVVPGQVLNITVGAGGSGGSGGSRNESNDPQKAGGTGVSGYLQIEY